MLQRKYRVSHSFFDFLCALCRSNSAIGVAIVIACSSSAAHSGETLRLTTRPNVTTSVFWSPNPNPNAKATLLLFPGGNGGYGRVEGGVATSRNFLVRSATLFRERGFNVAIFGRPSDQPDLDWDKRVSAEHIADIGAVIAHLKTLSDKPVWLVGTSRGTVSATAAALALDKKDIAGVVLSATVTNTKFVGAVPRQNVSALQMPVLLYHHADDACRACNPNDLSWLFRQLKNAAPKRLMIVRGGEGATGDPCEAEHHHGFIGMESRAVDDIASWILAPTP
jgi:hypothetical protein